MRADIPTGTEEAARCGMCRFFEPDSGRGQCRRYPPSAVDWPVVNETDWCGEWMARELGPMLGR